MLISNSSLETLLISKTFTNTLSLYSAVPVSFHKQVSSNSLPKLSFEYLTDFQLSSCSCFKFHVHFIILNLIYFLPCCMILLISLWINIYFINYYVTRFQFQSVQIQSTFPVQSLLSQILISIKNLNFMLL